MGKLTARQVDTLKLAGRHSDGGNLYLNIAKGGSKSWVMFYRYGDKRKEMGLGGAGEITLAEARKRALEASRLLSNGKDPLAEKQIEKRSLAAQTTFGVFADDYLKLHIGKFKNSSHQQQWKKALSDYCAPLRPIPIGEIDTEAVLKVLRPMWQRVPETASRTRGRIEAILDAARAQGFYKGENPARWKGHLKAVLPARQRLTRGHHAALAYDDLPTFMIKLRDQTESTAALALEFCILTATRTNETLGVVWSEIDLAKGVWSIPAVRMKTGQPHRVPLSLRSIEILTAMKPSRTSHNPHVFNGMKRGQSLSNMAMAAVLKRMGRDAITVHGFRSTFRDWASEQTSFPHEVCEMALAHVIGNKAEAAYRRGDLFEKRRKLMEAWQAFADSKPMAKVLPLKR
ncbi:MAG: integrase arm-type DNA-binding domain-containing protein [Aestuariivirga sp.]